MKKIYLDWNIINHLEEDRELYEYIRKNLSHFVFVYSPAHFSDLMKSYKENGGNTYFEKDLKRLETICETHLMYYSDKKMSVCKCPPTEFLEKEGKYYPTIKDIFNPDYFKKALNLNGLNLYDLFCTGLKSISLGNTVELPLIGRFSNAFEYLNCVLIFFESTLTNKKNVKNIRSKLTNSLEDKRIERLNDCSPDAVVGKIDEYLARYGYTDDFLGIVKHALQVNQQDNDKLIFESLYVGLDLMRIRSDDRNMMNILTDADHAFYGSFCDILVTDDVRMNYKTTAVYSYLKIDTKIICKKELMQYLKDEIDRERQIKEPLNEVLSNQHIPENYNEDDVYVKWTKLENHFWGFFNKLEFRLKVSTGQYMFVFSKERKLEKCVYYTETDKFFKLMKDVLQEPNIIELFEMDYVRRFRLNDPTTSFTFYYPPNIKMTLSVAEENDCLLPVLCAIPVNNDMQSAIYK